MSDNVDESDTVQANHLPEVNEAAVIPVDILDGDAEVCSISTRLHDYTPIQGGMFQRDELHDDRFRAGLQNGISP